MPTEQDATKPAPEEEKKDSAPSTPVVPADGASTEPEEPLFPLEEFVGDSPKQAETPVTTPPQTAAPTPTVAPTPLAEPASVPEAPATPTAPSTPLAPPPPPSQETTSAPLVPQNGTGKQTAKKGGIFSIFKKKTENSEPGSISTPPPAFQPGGSKAIIKRSSGLGRIILIALAILAVLTGVFFLFFYKVTIDVNTNPQPDLITIDSKSVSAGTHKFNPGFHEIKVEKNGYVSYYQSRKFSFGEKLDLSFNLQKANVASPVVQGAKSLNLSASGKFINFLGQDSRLYSIALDDPKAEPVSLSLEQFPPIRQTQFSLDNNFALILDEQALRIADFAKLDPTTQEKSTPLPPAANAISSFSWNNKASTYVSEANSKILYDLKTASSWDLFLMDRANGHSQIVMRIDPTHYPKFNVDWSDSDQIALLTGGEAGILDIGTREYTALEEKSNFVNGRWGPSGKYAILTRSTGQEFLLKDGKLIDLSIKGPAFSFKSANEAYFIENEKVVLVNFDTNSRINYAEISGLKNAVSFAVSQDSVYFLDNSGLKSAKLQQGAYEAQAK